MMALTTRLRAVEGASEADQIDALDEQGADAVFDGTATDTDRDFMDSTLRLISTASFVRDLFGATKRGLVGLKACSAEAPFVVMVSLLDAAGARLTITGYDLDQARPLDRADLLFAPVVITAGDLQGDWSARLAPIADALWNAFGYERCHVLRDPSGAWSGLPGGWR